MLDAPSVQLGDFLYERRFPIRECCVASARSASIHARDKPKDAIVSVRESTVFIGV
jgi:hypothetical protein